MRSTFKILFYLKKNAPKPDGTVPIMCRITVDGAIAQFSCKISVYTDLWDTKANRAIGKSKDAQKVNTKIDNIRTGINNNYQQLMQKDGFTTADKVKNAYLGLDVKQHTLLTLFEKHNSEFATKVGRTRAQSSLAVYWVVYRHLSVFILKQYKRKDISLKEVDIAFIKKFEEYLRIDKKCARNSINNYMTKAKHVVFEACTSGVLSANPFCLYKIENEQKDRGFLSSEELQQIIEFKLENATQILIRDSFVFSAFTGLAYIDVKNLTADNIIKSFDGHLWVDTKRQKTGTSSKIRLLEIPKRILEKYKGLSRDGKLFPIPSNGDCNKLLKRIGKECNIKTKVTYHMRRHRKIYYRLLINILDIVIFSIGNDLETSLVLRYA